jgi:NADPH-dependent 2,4-dienoyl-CoA reductase/sulfur reductase-like enzyme
MAQRLLVVGGDAAGMSAAMQARRRAADLEIVALERGRYTSYSACGIPYLAAGAVGSVDELVVRSPEQLRAQRIDVRTGHEVTGIDLAARRVEVHNLTHGRTFQLGFDALLVATGARPAVPAVEGIDSAHVHTVQTLEDAARLLDDAKRRRPSNVAIIGGGYIGLEMAEAFSSRGASVTVIEHGPEVMSHLDPEMGALVARAVRSMGIDVRTGASLLAVHPDRVSTSAGDVPADLLVLGTGSVPNAALGEDAGLLLGANGSLVVDRRQRTSAEGVWAAGDCCQSMNLVTGQPVHQALGTVANKQGRVAGINLGGGYATFAGVLGTAITRIGGLEVGRTGLGEAEAVAAGFGVVAARVEATTAASYLAEASAITVKLVAEEGSGRILGVQIAGGTGSAKRVDVIAAAIAGRLGVEDLVGLDLSYAPPMSPVWDPLQAAARVVLGRL